ncbi:MAG: DUF4252 domain-containing protein [Saprospiraceae bacterium]
MKKALVFFAFFLLAAVAATAQTDAISRFFNQYTDDERFTVVFISPKMFQMVSKIETNDPDWEKVRDVVKDLGGLRVLTADSITNGTQLYKEALSKIPTGEYSELLSVRDGKENVRIWIKDAGNVIHELLLLVGAPDEFVMLSFTGKIDLDKISNLAKTLDVEGAEHLEKVKGKKHE